MTTTFRRLMGLLTLISLAVVLVIPLNPVGTRFQHLMQLVAAGGVWGGLLTLGWRRKGLRGLLLALPVLAGVILALPARRMDREGLRADYVAELQKFESVPYFWGGESPRGIDCSGLPRRALRNALLSRAARQADAGALRMFAEQWMFDTSALAMSEGYRGFTRDLGIKGTIATLDCGLLEPGDLAVTEGGAHVLVFLGGERWIQADPGLGRVAALNGRTEDNSWFRHPVTLHRWTVFS
ncbi:MAG: NlpC/P60 family protein [Verrucomicrobiota bacterium]